MTDEFDEVLEGEAQELTEGESEREPRPEELPAIAELRALDRPSAAAMPTRQAAALAATGFVAGAAAAALVRRRGGRRVRRNGRLGARRSAEGLPVISTHTYLLRVQVLGRPAE
ncbi:MAG: hypothetical protein ACTHQQ_15000 [Solirubrobacteraceae bacterium]